VLIPSNGNDTYNDNTARGDRSLLGKMC